MAAFSPHRRHRGPRPARPELRQSEGADPWWNPAVENQAIDRTHRIGQTSHVIAYRLLVKESIEEKIQKLQRSKSALAADILGEESFTRALTLDDFWFLLGD